MNARTIAIGALVAVVVVVFASTRGGEDPYIAQLRMASAGGLKDGSPVTIGGINIGKVDVDVDVEGSGSVAVANLRIERKFAPLGRDARATILSSNLLGQKQVQVTKGNAEADPAPSGFVIPEDRVTEATDLDRVLSVLDADTRARLAIFVNEAGTAFTGRKADFNRFLRDIAPAVRSGTDLLGELADDNAELGRLVETSDRYVAEVAARRDDVVRLVDRMGQAATTGATKRAELRATLAQAPGGLRALRMFLTELRGTTMPLQAAARDLSAVADPLADTLGRLEPFRAAAVPALRTATKVAPMFEQLAAKATPVLRRAAPTAASARKLAAGALPPVFDVTDRSINNSLAVVDNWAGAIQLRDGLSHIFRGEASIAPDALQSVIDRLAPKPKVHKKRPTRKPGLTLPKVSDGNGGGTLLPSRPKIELPGLPEITVPDVTKAVDGALTDTTALLDYLLGR